MTDGEECPSHRATVTTDSPASNMIDAWARLDRDAAALQEPYRAWRGTSHSSIVIEQGRLQLWVAAIYPYHFADLLSTEQLRVLDAADLRPADVEPRTWLDRFLPHRRERPPYLTISDDGQDLTHNPEGEQQ